METLNDTPASGIHKYINVEEYEDFATDKKIATVSVFGVAAFRFERVEDARYAHSDLLVTAMMKYAPNDVLSFPIIVSKAGQSVSMISKREVLEAIIKSATTELGKVALEE